MNGLLYSVGLAHRLRDGRFGLNSLETNLFQVFTGLASRPYGGKAISDPGYVLGARNGTRAEFGIGASG